MAFPRRGARFRAVTLLGVVAAVAGSAPAGAQPSTLGRQSVLRINVVRPMQVGRVIAGVAGTTSPGEMPAQFELIGPPGATIEVSFRLPTDLAGESGSRVGLAFGPTSAAWSPSSSDLDLVPFDPRTPTTFVIPPSGRALISLHGSAQAAQHAHGGSYAGQITLLARLE